MRHKTRVLFITNMCPHYRVHLFKALEQEYDVEFVFFSDGSFEKYWEKSNELSYEFKKVTRVRSIRLGKYFRFSMELLKILIKSDADIIIKCFNGVIEVPMTFLVEYLRKKPIIFWVSIWESPQSLLDRMNLWLKLKIVERGNAIATYGPHVTQYLLNNGFEPNKLFNVWQTLDNSFYGRSVSQEEIDIMRERLALGSKKIVLFVGRLHPQKGLDRLIRAISKIQLSNVILLAVGNGTHKEECQKLGEELNVPIVFPGYVGYPELATYYRSATVVVCPSVEWRDITETWGWVVNEAMNQGCPVIASNKVGAAVAGLVDHDVDGLIYKWDSLEELRDALVKILTNDNKRETMGKEALRKITRWNTALSIKGFIDAIEFVSNRKEPSYEH